MAINLGKPINNNPLGIDENGLRINKTVTNPTLPIGKTTSKTSKKSNNNLIKLYRDIKNHFAVEIIYRSDYDPRVY